MAHYHSHASWMQLKLSKQINPRISHCITGLLASVAIAAVTPLSAATVVPSAAVATSSWFGPVSTDNLINGAGLSGVGPVSRQSHDNQGAATTMWHAGPITAGLNDATGNPPVVADQALVFTLPRLYDLTDAYIWNHSQANLVSRGVKEFEILVSSETNPLTASFNSIGVFNLASAIGNGSDTRQQVSFDNVATGVNLVKFDIHSAQSGATNDLVGLAEVRFEGVQQALSRQQLLNWGIETHNEIVKTLAPLGQILPAETAHLDGSTTGGVGGRAFAWPLSAQFRVYNSLTQYNAANYGPALRAFSDQFRSEFWSPQGGYYCCRGGGERFYDDNAHIAVALAEAYEITGDQAFLNRAIETYDFLLTGETTLPGETGGSYWSEFDHSFLDSATALQGARAALMIYKATDDQQYLQHALRTYAWARDTTQVANGTFLEKKFLSGPQAGTVGNFALVNFAGFGIAANVLFYETTGDEDYLEEAQRIATTSVNNYFNGSTGAINDEGFWAYEMVDSLVELYEVDGNQLWFDTAANAMEWLFENKQDPNGHYGRFWGREGPQVGELLEWDLNDQSPVARAFLRLGLADVPGDFDHDGSVDGADFLAMQADNMTSVRLAAWRAHYGSSGGDLISSPFAGAKTVPEPTAAALIAFGVMINLCQTRRSSHR